MSEPAYSCHRSVLAGCLIACVLVCLALAACGSNPDAEPFRIGLLAPLSNVPEHLNSRMVTGAAELAVKEINAAGGVRYKGRVVPVELVVMDDENHVESAMSAGRMLITRYKVASIVGPFLSRIAIPLAAEAERARVVMISPASTNPLTTQGKRFVFRTTFLDTFQGEVMARVAIQDMQARVAAVLYDSANAYSEGVARYFALTVKQLGGEVVLEPYVTGEKDFTPHLKRIRDAGAQAVLFPNMAEDLKLQVPLFRRLAFADICLGTDAWQSPSLLVLEGFDGCRFSTNFTASSLGGKGNHFVQTLRAMSGQTPNNVSAATYDTFMLLREVLRTSDVGSSETLRDALSNHGVFHGVTGEISFNGSGDPLKSAFVVQVSDGQEVLIKEVKP